MSEIKGNMKEYKLVAKVLTEVFSNKAEVYIQNRIIKIIQIIIFIKMLFVGL